MQYPPLPKSFPTLNRNAAQQVIAFVDYFLVVKSVSCSTGLKPASDAFSQVQASAGRAPHEHEPVLGLVFSVEARSQVHAPAGRARHEQRGPSTAFSLGAFSQLQWRAFVLPQEQVACLAQTHSLLPLPQQVVGFALSAVIVAAGERRLVVVE